MPGTPSRALVKAASFPLSPAGASSSISFSSPKRSLMRSASWRMGESGLCMPALP